jgi:hypothetical protein
MLCSIQADADHAVYLHGFFGSRPHALMLDIYLIASRIATSDFREYIGDSQRLANFVESG